MEFINHLLPESKTGLQYLDIALNIFHSGLVLFVVFGVFFRRLIKYHFPILLAIWASWVGLGMYVHHLGYCIITDWHWQVKAREGQVNLPGSYITYIFNAATGIKASNIIVAQITGAVMVIITLVSGIRYFSWLRNRKTLRA